MDGESYHTLNPFALDLLAYSELFSLSKSLNLGASSPKRGRVSKEVLIERIIGFHRERNQDGHTLIDNEESCEDSNFSMNVTGNNFAVLPVIPDTSEKRKKARMDEGSEGFQVAVVKADPTHLRALQGIDTAPETVPETPSKSILKKCMSPTSVEKPDDIENNINFNKYGSKLTPGKLDKITFSPFNGVKVIPHRTLINNPCKRISFLEVAEEGDEEEEEEEPMYEAEEEDDDEDESLYAEENIYSDDEETSYLVMSNTQLNSGMQVGSEDENEGEDDEDQGEDENELPSLLPRGYSAKYAHAQSHTQLNQQQLNSHDFFEL